MHTARWTRRNDQSRRNLRALGVCCSIIAMVLVSTIAESLQAGAIVGAAGYGLTLLWWHLSRA